MQRRPTILSARSVNEWLNRVAQKHRQFKSLNLSQNQREKIDRWVEAAFVSSTLGLEGVKVSEADAARVAGMSQSLTEPAAETDLPAIELLRAFRLVRDVALTRGASAVLNADLLLKLQPSASGFRKTPGLKGAGLNPAAPERLAASIDSACQWFTAESFAELNPVEQASIVFLRLLELQPFEDRNQRIAILASSLFTMRSDLPPVIVTNDLADDYRAAIDESTRGNTQRMVELVGTAVEQSLGRMTGLASG